MRIRIVMLTTAVLVMSVGAVPAVAERDAPHAQAASHARAASGHVVKMGEYFYRPKRLSIRAGDTVRFVNVGKIEHTVADSSKSGTIRSRIIKPRPLAHGRSQTVRFKSRGTVYYLCTFHPSLMRGVVVVR
jgi:plastocyanin